MKKLTLTIAGISLAVALAAPAWAEKSSAPEETMDKDMSMMSNTDDGMPMTEGTMRKVDMDTRKVTIKHGPIKNLKMPPMTMVFGVEESVDMSGLAAGEDVAFRVIDEGGKMVITQIKPR